MNILHRALRTLQKAHGFVLDVYFYHVTLKHPLRKAIDLARNTL